MYTFQLATAGLLGRTVTPRYPMLLATVGLLGRTVTPRYTLQLATTGLLGLTVTPGYTLLLATTGLLGRTVTQGIPYPKCGTVADNPLTVASERHAGLEVDLPAAHVQQVLETITPLALTITCEQGHH